MEGDATTIVVAVAAVVAASLLGWLFAARRTRAGGSAWATPRSDRSWRMAVTASVVVGTVAAATQAPVIAVIWLLVPLNLLLGRRENVPFSTYPMFSKPAGTASALRFEDEAGSLIPVRQMGISPHTQEKRFHTEVRAARARGITDLDEARRAAAEVIAADIEAHRRPGARWANTPITISLVEYSLESGALETAHTTLLETRPC